MLRIEESTRTADGLVAGTLLLAFGLPWVANWLLQFDFAEFQARYDAFFAGVGAIVMGSTTYEWILDHEFAAGCRDGRVRLWTRNHKDATTYFPEFVGEQGAKSSGHGAHAALPISRSRTTRG